MVVVVFGIFFKIFRARTCFRCMDLSGLDGRYSCGAVGVADMWMRRINHLVSFYLFFISVLVVQIDQHLVPGMHAKVIHACVDLHAQVLKKVGLDICVGTCLAVTLRPRGAESFALHLAVSTMRT